uniref:Uncharacterized protein n=2 Tax=Schistocephalus solidus TaxID=70667 RepID=A0A0X3Q803_SCHSO
MIVVNNSNMNPSPDSNETLSGSLVAPAGGTGSGLSCGHEVTTHRLSPYARPTAVLTNAGAKQIITLKQLPQRQRPSILRRVSGVSPIVVDSGPNKAQSQPIYISTPQLPMKMLSTVPVTSSPSTRPQSFLATDTPTLAATGDVTPTSASVVDEFSYVPRLGSLPKIPGACLRKPGFAGDSTVPPAFTVVLGGIPVDLVNRLFAPTNPDASRLLSSMRGAPTGTSVSPTPAAVVAAPLATGKSISGPLFLPREGTAAAAIVSNPSDPVPSTPLSCLSTSISGRINSIRRLEHEHFGLCPCLSCHTFRRGISRSK